MPTYVFENPDGKHIEHFCPVAGEPKIGDTLEINGQPHIRVPSFIIGEAVTTVCSKYPYTSMRHGAFMKGAKHDSQGRAIIESQNHEKKFMAMHDLARD